MPAAAKIWRVQLSWTIPWKTLRGAFTQVYHTHSTLVNTRAVIVSVMRGELIDCHDTEQFAIHEYVLFDLCALKPDNVHLSTFAVTEL